MFSVESLVFSVWGLVLSVERLDFEVGVFGFRVSGVECRERVFLWMGAGLDFGF